ncbi:MAG: class I SAM-dependent methyltransferase [Anaerolineae bacterium]
MEYVACNLCGSRNSEILYPSTVSEGPTAGDIEHFRCTSASYGKHHTIVKCRNCGLVYTNPRHKASAILHSYEEVVDKLYVEEREGRVLTFQRNLRPLEELMPPDQGRRLLDVGCHIGVFLEIAQERGWETWGVEPSRWAAREARSRGLRVIEGTLDDAHLAEGSFDVITMWDVSEHLTDPLRELRESHRLLTKGGLICIHTMNIESPLARLMGSRWPWLMEMHLYYFSPRTLGEMLRKAGFTVVKMVNQGRFLRLGYLVTRIEPYSPLIARGMGKLVTALGLKDKAVPINLGDLFTTFARKD